MLTLIRILRGKTLKNPKNKQKGRQLSFSAINKIRSWRAWLAKIYSRFAFIAQYYSKKLVYGFKLRTPRLKQMHLNSFPAIHIKKMDALDFTLKFSSELLVLLLGLAVAGSNLYFFKLKTFSDQSFAAKFLDNHSSINPKLYAKNNSIVTTVAGVNGLLPQAQAEGYIGLENQQAAPDNNDTDTALNDGMIVRPNSDSVQALLDKQIKIYTTRPGDTLKSIAAANGINEQTIMWANKLTSVGIKPGWQLIILPVNGILHQADSNDTLPDIANAYNPEKYNTNKKIRDEAANQLMDKIISYNLLDGPEDIDAGQLVIVPGGVMPTPPAPPAKPKTPSKPGITPPKTYDAGTGHLFPWGYCTYYVATKVHVPWGGNAKNWLANAKAYGAVVTKTPTVGAIVVTNDSRRYGHVALVEQVSGDQFLVSEMNYKGKGIISTRWIDSDSSSVKGFIYP